VRTLQTEAESEGKGRTFRAALLAYVRADCLWDGAATESGVVRPAWFACAASDAEIRPFMANLRCGRKAVVPESSNTKKYQLRFELMRRAGYEYATQRTNAGTCVTAFLPELFRLDPGLVDPKGARFVVLPSRAWVETETARLGREAGAAVRHVERVRRRVDTSGRPAPDRAVLEALAPVAPLFCAYLDRRVRAPLVPDPRFQLQVVVAMLDAGLASFGHEPHSFRERGWGQHDGFWFLEVDTAAAGLAPGIACRASHEEIEALLAEQVRRYFEVIG
jgi:hypothetical protein